MVRGTQLTLRGVLLKSNKRFLPFNTINEGVEKGEKKLCFACNGDPFCIDSLRMRSKISTGYRWRFKQKGRGNDIIQSQSKNDH